MKMTAAIVEEFNKPLVIEQLEIPALKCGQVLVRVYCSGVCGAQLGHIAGVKTKKEFLPFLLGHEGGGEVIDVGNSVRHVKKGDRVVLHWRPGVGIESEFPRYTRQDGSTVGGGLVTTFNDYAVVSENRVTRIEKDIPFSKAIPYEIAALMGCCVTTGLGLINNEAHLKIGESIAVFGCGGVGLSVIQGASMVSGNPIIAIDLSDDKLNLSKECGATHTINSRYSTQTLNIVKNIVGLSAGVDVFVDTTGNAKCIEMAYDMTKAGGRTIMVGQPKPGQEFVFRNPVQHFNGKTLMDSEGGQTNPSTDIARYLELYRKGKLDLEKLVFSNSDASCFRLFEINRVLDMLRSGSILGRAIIRME